MRTRHRARDEVHDAVAKGFGGAGRVLPSGHPATAPPTPPPPPPLPSVVADDEVGEGACVAEEERETRDGAAVEDADGQGE